jgi:hypothetical protein
MGKLNRLYAPGQNIAFSMSPRGYNRPVRVKARVRKGLPSGRVQKGPHCHAGDSEASGRGHVQAFIYVLYCLHIYIICNIVSYCTHAYSYWFILVSYCPNIYSVFLIGSYCFILCAYESLDF